MREFILIDLRTQMPYLPASMQTWSRKRFLDWLHLYGDVSRYRDLSGYWTEVHDYWNDWYSFTSWIGLWTPFTLHETDSGDLSLHVSGTGIRAWNVASTEEQK
jgi:hypothetical protein